jgi:hypothetical protein
MSEQIQNKWVLNNIDSLLEEIQYNRIIANSNEEELKQYDKLLLEKLKNMIKGTNKISQLNEEQIKKVFKRITQEEELDDDTKIKSIVEYIIHTYEPEAYSNKQFVFHIPDVEYGIYIKSFKIDVNSEDYHILDGISTFIHPVIEEGVPFPVLSYEFYRNGKIVPNSLKETFSQGSNYSINGKYINLDNGDKDEILYSIFQQINDGIKKHYSWLQKLIDLNEPEMKLLIINSEIRDKINFSILSSSSSSLKSVSPKSFSNTILNKTINTKNFIYLNNLRNSQEILNFIFNNYDPSTYLNKNIIIKLYNQKMNDPDITSYTIDENGKFSKNGVYLSLNHYYEDDPYSDEDEGGYPILSYAFYKNDKLIGNNIFHNDEGISIRNTIDEFFIINGRKSKISENGELINSILGQIYDKIFRDNVYPNLLDIIMDDKGNDLIILDSVEKVDKVKIIF